MPMPYRKTAVSLPSRAIASATSANTPHQLPASVLALRDDSMSFLSVRPCLRIQNTICTISTAAISRIAIIQPGIQNTDHQQGLDAFAPDNKQDLAHYFPFSCTLFGDNHALRHVQMEVVKEFVFAGTQGCDHDKRLRAGCEDFFLAQLNTFELGGALADVVDFDLDALPCRDFNARRNELAVLHLKFKSQDICGEDTRGKQGTDQTDQTGQDLGATCFTQRHPLLLHCRALHCAINKSKQMREPGQRDMSGTMPAHDSFSSGLRISNRPFCRRRRK